MVPISRRMFLVSSVALVVAACSDSEDSGGAATTAGQPPETTAVDSSTSTISSSTDPSSADPSSTDAAPTSTSPLTTSTSSTTSTTEPVETTSVPPSPTGLDSDPFMLGVASGDPDATSVVLWTRLAPAPLSGGGMPDVDVPLAWQLSADQGFSIIAAEGVAVATAAHAHSVHAIVEPPAGMTGELFYRFQLGDFTSPVGRTMLAPAAAVDTATFVTASCQDYQDGFFTAHADIVTQRPDFLLWLGDYIYEGSANTVGEAGTVRTTATPEPMDLEGYRDRYALYKSDPLLQASHQVCPWFVIWDDHEVENNYAGLTPQDPADAAGFDVRRQAAYTAWWEHQPVRLDAPPAIGEYRIHRAARWGDLIGMALLDTRQYRSDQACGDVTLNLDPACPETFADERTLTGPEQEQFLFDTIGNQGTTWNVIAQQVVMADVTIGGAVLNYDQWDGYPADRERILRHLADNAVANAIVLSGDIHLAGIAVLRVGADMGGVGGTPVAVEFVDTSISSAGLVPTETTSLVKSFAEIVDAELDHRGYTLHTVTPSTWTATYRIVDSVLVPDGATSTFNTYIVDAGTPAVRIA